VQSPGTAGFDWLSLLPLSAALAFAISGIVTKRLTRTQSGFAILFWMNAIQLPLNLVGVEWGFWERIGSEALPAVAGLCVAGTLGQYALAQALRHGDATLVVPLDFLRIPLIAAIGAMFYAEPPDPAIFLGAGLLIAAIMVNLRAEFRSRETGSDVKPSAPEREPTAPSS
jgi:drug/metabolite transporter (DMT)-like permease